MFTGLRRSAPGWTNQGVRLNFYFAENPTFLIWVDIGGQVPTGPEARSIVTYSQSTDPDSPHFSDMTQLFSDEGWVQLPFQVGEIMADPELETRFLMEPR